MPNILIVENESIVRLDIKRTLDTLGYGVAGEAGDAQHAMTLSMDLRPDLVLMDIGLNGTMTGVEAAIAIRNELHVPVIFLTGCSDAATLARARTAEPYGYVAKPFNASQVKAAVEMALYKHGQDSGVLRERDALFRMAVSKRRSVEPFFVRENGRLLKVPLEHVYYIQAMKDNVVLHTLNQRHVTCTAIGHIEDELPGHDFLRVHRSYIVRISKIATVELPHIYLTEDKGLIPIGPSYLDALKKRLQVD